jgi:exonuclease SbcD
LNYCDRPSKSTLKENTMSQSDEHKNLRIILTGDVHIGRSSSRIPRSAPQGDLRAAAAWLRIVETAIQEDVDLVCLSGDVADQSNKFWEAIGPLEQGIRQLAEKGIRTVAVSGNHDYDVLPRLADQLPPEQFVLLGRRGEWERYTISHEDKPLLHIDGWSFPAHQVHVSPLSGYDLEADPNTPILGMVHGDLGVADSPYAPLELSALQSLPVSGWLLGHIHARHLINESGCPWVLYPGSPQSFDPGETGLHGVWLVELDHGQMGIPVQIPLSSTRYDSLQIDLSGAADSSEVEQRILDGVRDYAKSIVTESGPALAHISLRIHLVGSTPVSHEVRESVKNVTEDLSLPIGNATLSIEKTDVETTPLIDLQEYASSTHSAPGAVARLLLNLESRADDEDFQALLQETRREIGQVFRHRDYTQLDTPEITDDLVIDYLEKQARAFLTELVSQSV